MSKKIALITGIVGQDSSYLTELLLSKDYKVIGLKRRSSTDNTERIRHLFNNEDFKLVEADITDSSGINRIISETKPDEIYNLAAQSHVATSFDQPITTFAINTLGLLNILEAIRQFSPTSKLYHASTSEIFGSSPGPQNEETRFCPISPYAISKLASHELIKLYRDAYGLFCCSGVLFNHESKRRGENFVTRKITKYVADLISFMNKNNEIIPTKNVHVKPLFLGNLDAKRDWSHAADMTRGMYMILQQDKPDDFVLGSGVTRTVREFAIAAFQIAGLDFDDYREIDPNLFRPAEVNFLQADCTKAKNILGWELQISFEELVKEMVMADVKISDT